MVATRPASSAGEASPSSRRAVAALKAAMPELQVIGGLETKPVEPAKPAEEAKPAEPAK